MRVNPQRTLLLLSALAAVGAVVFYLLPPKMPKLAPVPALQPKPESGLTAAAAPAPDGAPTPEPSTGNPTPELSASSVPAAPPLSARTDALPTNSGTGPAAENGAAPAPAERSAPGRTRPPVAPLPGRLATLAEEIEISVPEGARLPLVLAQADPVENPAAPGNQAREDILDAMTLQFAREIAKTQAESARAGETPDEYLNRWERAAEQSDERFRTFFGGEFYMRWQIRTHLQRHGYKSAGQQ